MHFYEAKAWPLISSTHCYTTKSVGGKHWATQRQVFWVTEAGSLRWRPVPLTKQGHFICMGYAASFHWEAFSLMPPDRSKKEPENRDEGVSKPMDAVDAAQSFAEGIEQSSVQGMPPVSRSHSLVQDGSSENLSSLEFSSISLPTDLLMSNDQLEQPIIEVNADLANVLSNPAASPKSMENHSITLMVRSIGKRVGEPSNHSFRAFVNVRPAALHLVESEVGTQTPRLWWGSADNSLLQRMEVSLQGDDEEVRNVLSSTLDLSLETPVLALDSNDKYLAAACQDGSVILLREEEGEILRKIVVDGPIIAIQLHGRSIVFGSLCGYVARLVGEDQPELLFQGLLTASGGEDSVLALHQPPMGTLCWVGTQSGRCLAIRHKRIEWECQLPFPVYGISSYNEGVLVITQHSVHWLRPVDEAVKRATERLDILKSRPVPETTSAQTGA